MSETTSSADLRQALRELPIASECIVVESRPPHASLSRDSLAPSAPEFDALVQEIGRRRTPASPPVAVLVTGPGDAVPARAEVATHLAAGLAAHGHRVVLVDTDFVAPGLSGLVPDTGDEGVIDMLRFGRSCRGVLQRPLANGPSIVPAGSFPLEAPLNLDADTLRGLVHRVGVHCDISLFVGPHRIGQAVNGLAAVCDCTVYASETLASRLANERAPLAELVRHGVSLAGTVTFVPDAARRPTAEDTTQVQAAKPATLPTPAPTAADAAEPTDRVPAEASAIPLPAHPSNKAESRSPARSDKAGSTVPDWSDALADDDIEMELGDAEFAYEEGGGYSRTPLFVLVTLVVLIGSFLGWALWTKRDMGRQVGQELAGEKPSIQGSAEPDDGAASQAIGSQEEPTVQGSDNAPPPAPPPEPPVQRPPAKERGGGPEARSNAARVAVGAQREEISEPDVVPPARARPEEEGNETLPDGNVPWSVATFTVHVASFQTIEKAYEEIANIQRHGFSARAVRTDLGSKGMWYRVYVGGYQTRADALAASQAILKFPEYNYAQVIRVPKP